MSEQNPKPDKSDIPPEIWEKFKGSRIWKEISAMVSIRHAADVASLKKAATMDKVSRLQGRIEEQEFILNLPNIMLGHFDDELALREHQEEMEGQGDGSE